MPQLPTNIYQGKKVEPVYNQEDARMMNVRLFSSVNYPAGTILGEATAAAANEVQNLTPTGTISGGTFNITFSGLTTAALAFNASIATIQAALEALSNIGVGNVLVAGGPINTTLVTLTFRNALGSVNVPQVTITNNLTGASPVLTPTTATAGSAGPGTFGAYASGNADGTQVAKAILPYPVSVDGTGNITITATTGQVGGDRYETFKSIGVYFSGIFQTSELVGLDAGAVTNLGRLISGTTTSGLISLI